MYKDLYDHDWNSNRTVTRSNINTRNISDDISHSVARIQVEYLLLHSTLEINSNLH